ncbi:MAG: ABC transporter permease [Paracoccaceae bacterium]
MFDFCADPDVLVGIDWFACYLTTGKHLAFYGSFLTVLLLLAIVAPLAILVGLGGAFAKRSRIRPARWIGIAFTSVVRGVPDIIFFLFVPIALDQGLEWLRHQAFCPDWSEPVRRGNDFVVCPQAKLPLATASAGVHAAYGFALAVVAYAAVFGAFAANILDGALSAVPRGQLEAGRAVGMSERQILWRIHLPQMWRYALPGLSNLWQILIKATPLLFLLGVEDVVYWARELGGAKTSAFDYPHPDWRAWYFAGLLLFYLLLTWISQVGFGALMRRAGRGQPSGLGA